jgi:hypothetical protein
MKNKILWICLLGIVTAADLEWKGEFRYRVESDKGMSNSDSLFNSGRNTFHYTRSRISLRMVQGPITGFAQIQDSRLLGGEENLSGSSKPSGTKIEFHQVYFEIHNLLKRNWSMRFGRFELPLGGERLFSKTNWNNFGRSFEGMHSFGSNRIGRLDLFSLFIVERSNEYPSDEYDEVINGLYFTKKRDIGLFRLLDLYMINEQTQSIDLNRDLYRNTVGSRMFIKFLFLDIVSEFAYQFGKWENGSLFIDIKSEMFVLNARIDLSMIPIVEMISFGKENFTGFDSTLSNISGFANPYGAGHKYHGYYDNHTRFNDNFQKGLDEWNVKTVFSLPGDFKLNVHYHDFKDGVHSDPLGTELDLIFSKKLGFGGVLQQGFARYWEDGGSQLDYSWLMLTFTL